MAVLATKADHYLELLNDVLQKGIRLGDLDRFYIVEHIEKTMNSDPVVALLLKAVLAHAEGRISDARVAFESSIAIADDIPVLHSNYAKMLSDTGFSEDAATQIRKSIDCCKNTNDWASLKHVALSALIIHDVELLKEIATIANKLSFNEEIFLHVAIACGMEGVSDDECNALLEKTFPDDTLRRLSVEITPDRWAEMNAIADRFSKYVE